MAAASADSLSALLLSQINEATSSGSRTASAELIRDLGDSSSSAHAQLLSLTSQSLKELRAQPAALQQATSSLDSQLSTLCARHVPSFVQVHQATSTLPDALDSLDSRLQILIDHELPSLSKAVQSFQDRIQAPIAARDRACNLMDKYDSMLKDLLDLPRLLMTCVRANHPIEALQLGSHVARIAAACAEDGVRDDVKDSSSQSNSSRRAVLYAVKTESWTYLRQLREDLLRGLGARGVRLPAARRHYLLLRRFKDVDEAGKSARILDDEILALPPSTVCLSFLRSRWHSIDEIGPQSSGFADDPVGALSSYISQWRDAVGEACSIAIALFADVSSLAAEGEMSTANSDDELSSLTLLSTFALKSLHKLESLVVQLVPQVGDLSQNKPIEEVYESLSSLHMQCAYAAASLARHGLDFSFSPGIFSAFEEQVKKLCDQKGLEEKQGEADAQDEQSNVQPKDEVTGADSVQPST